MLRRDPKRRLAHQSAFRLELTPLRTPEPELRVVVSTKVAKKATERNRLKRRLRAIWRALPQPARSRITVYAKKVALELSFSDLRAQFSTALKHI